MAQTFMFADDGIVPNNPVLPVVIMPAVVSPDINLVEATYKANGWGGTWQYIVFSETHYHPDAHEVLTCVSGWGDLHIGGDKGRNFRVTPGDCMVLPAGTGHSLAASGGDFLVVGAYPPGQENPQTLSASDEIHNDVFEQVAAVSLPPSCPIMGKDGPTMQAWSD